MGNVWVIGIKEWGGKGDVFVVMEGGGDMKEGEMELVGLMKMWLNGMVLEREELEEERLWRLGE